MTCELNMELINYRLRLNEFVLGTELELGIKGGKEIGRASCRERVSPYV